MTQNRTIPLADHVGACAMADTLDHGYQQGLEKAEALIRQQHAALVDTVEVVRRLASQYQIDDSLLDVSLSPAVAAIKAAEESRS